MKEASLGDLLDDLRSLVADAETMLADSAQHAGAEARGRAADALARASSRLKDLETRVGAGAKAAADGATDYVRANPWQSIGIAAAVGVVIGVLLGRK